MFGETNLINKTNMELKENKNIINQKADKRGSVVIRTKKHYCKMIYDYIKDNHIYKKLIASEYM